MSILNSSGAREAAYFFRSVAAFARAFGPSTFVFVTFAAATALSKRGWPIDTPLLVYRAQAAGGGSS